MCMCWLGGCISRKERDILHLILMDDLEIRRDIQKNLSIRHLLWMEGRRDGWIDACAKL